MEGTQRSPSWRRSRQRGASIVEAVIALPILLAVILGAIQFGLVYEAKATLNHATLTAARLGAVRNASPDAMRQGLARGLVPLYSPDSSFTGVARTIGRINRDLATDARIRILNPTREAFEDFGIDVDGEREIPNDRLHTRSTDAGAQSGINIQDANLLKVQITYGYELQVPLVNWFISRVLLGVRRNADPFEQQLLRRLRIPIIATSTVRMQSPARLNDAVVARGDFPTLDRIPADSAPPPEEEESTDEDDDQGGDGTGSQPGDADNDDDEGSSLDDGFFGFGEGGGGTVDGGDSEEGAGPNGGNPSECAGGDSSSPFPNGPVPPGESTPLQERPGLPNWPPDIEVNGMSGSDAAIAAVSLASLSVGNPIHVVTGNKYQVEMDVAPLPGALSLEFRRHYNSAAVADNGPVGAGWRHSYATVLQKRPDGTIDVVQADGRRVLFSRAANRLLGLRAGDGTIDVLESGYRWTWPSRHELYFDSDGRLIKMRKQDATLLLRYDDAGALSSVTDAQARSLRFEYYPNGRLASVRGPGHIAVHYNYDHDGNLYEALATDGTTRRYVYEDERHPHHLTGVSVGSVRPAAYGGRRKFERLATWGYDEKGRAVFSSHPDDAGKVSLMFGDGFTDVVDAFGKATRYIKSMRDGVSYVSEVRGPGCGCGPGDARYEYDERFQRTRVDFEHAASLQYQYDAQGRLIEIVRSAGESKLLLAHYEYDGESARIARIRRPSVKAGEVAELEIEYQRDDLPTAFVEKGFTPATSGYLRVERRTLLRYDTNGRLVRIDGPRTDVDDWTDFEYDVVGLLRAIKFPDGRERRVLSYDEAGRPLRVVEAGGRTLEIRYDAQGRVTSLMQQRRHGAQTTKYAYDAAGRMVSMTDAFGRTTRFAFDTAGRANRVRASDSDIALWVHYAPDDLIQRIVAVGAGGQSLRTLSYTYDTQRRLTEVRDGSGAPLLRFEHDDSDARPDRHIDALDRDTAFVHDGYGGLSSIRAPDGGVTQYERDPAGRVSDVVAPNGVRTTYRYDDFGRRVEEVSADRGTTRYAYDSSNNLIEKTDGRGMATHLAYDAANRLIKVVRPEGLSQLTYARGMLAFVDGEIEDESYEYDEDRQLIAHTRTIGNQSFTTRFSYDAFGRLETRALPSGLRLRYHYGQSARPLSITRERWLSDEVVVATEHEHHRNRARLDMLGQFESGNGITTRTHFDSEGRFDRRTIEGVTTLAYERDAAAQITMLSRDGLSRTFEYDRAGRMTRAVNAQTQFGFTYDSNGNRTSFVQAFAPTDSRDPSRSERDHVSATVRLPVSTVSYRYFPGTNRLAQRGADMRADYAYDGAGNPTRMGAHRYEYDSSGRATKLFENDRLVAEYAYNFWGERIRKIVHSGTQRSTTTYVYEQQKLLAEIGNGGDIEREYVYVDQHPVAMFEGGASFWIHTDDRGAPIAVTDKHRTVVWGAEYEPFGSARLSEDPDRNGTRMTVDLRLPGQYLDRESGTHYNYFRQYDPATGRYHSPDPAGLFDGTNQFAYAQNSPLMNVDSLGLYDEMVHYYITYFLGLVAGLPQDVARTMAIAAQYVDENYLTQPIHDPVLPNYNALPLYHFVLDYDQRVYGDNTGNRFFRFQAPQSTQLNNLFASTDATRLRNLWIQTHPTGIPGLCPLPSYVDINNARYQLFGEYLHAFEDTFAHRDAYNMPYAIDSNVANTPVAWAGHGGPNVPDMFGHAPDRTYNQNYRVPSRCTFASGRGVVVENLSESECRAQGGVQWTRANDDDTSECEVRYALGGVSTVTGTTEAECAALGRQSIATGSTYRPGSGQIWAFNELRTLRMEYEVFGRIQQNFGDEIARNRQNGAPVFSWADIAGGAWDDGNPLHNSRIGVEQDFEEWAEGRGFEHRGGTPLYNPAVVLQQFNSSRDDESSRLAVLNEWLRLRRLPTIEAWRDVTDEASLRAQNIGWIPARSFEGVLLPADAPCFGRGCRR